MPVPSPTFRGHEGPVEIGRATQAGAPAGLGPVTVEFVRYPGCQQLKLWLPQSGESGYGELRVVGKGGRVIDRAAVAQRLNGSVQLLWDTLAWPPGCYTLEIDHAQGWRHVLPLRKVHDGQAAGPAAPAPHRDQEADVLLREQVAAGLATRLARRVVTDGDARSGSVVYIDGPVHIRFAQEMGGQGCRSLLFVPRPQDWAASTATPLAQRDEILRFVADEARRLVGGTRAVIGDAFIEIH